MKIIRGKYLIEIPSNRKVIEDTSGIRHVIRLNGTNEPPLNRTIEAFILDDVLIDWQPDLSDLPEHEVRRISVLLGYGLSSGTEILDEHWSAARNWAKILENEARRVGRDRWNVNVYPVVHYSDGIGYFSYNWADLARAGRETYQDTTWTHLCGINGSRGSPCGSADLGGTRSWSRKNCVASKKTHIHETLGHSIMAIEHSGDINSGYAYGETDTWMGNSPNRDHSDFNTPHLYHAGLLEENNIVNLERGNSIRTHLVQGSDDPLSLKLGENKMVLCQVANTGLTRLVAVAFYKGSVRIYEPGHRMTTTWVRTGLVKRLNSVNSSYEHAGVFVRVLKLDDYSAEVEVFNNTSTLPLSATEPQWLLPSTTAEPKIGNWCRGLWGNKKWSVQGMHIGFTDDGRLVVHWLTWDRYVAGKHRFFWAVCDVNETYAKGSLITSDKYGLTREVGQIQLFWYDQNNGIARGECTGIGRFAVPLTRISNGSPNSLAGYYGIGNGQGIAISVNESERAVAYWLLHEGNDQVWRMLLGPLNNMIIYDVKGGQALVKSDFIIEEIGTAKIENDKIFFTINGEVDQRTLMRLA